MKTEARDSEGSRVGSLDIRGTRVGQQGEGSRKREKQQRRWKFSKQSQLILGFLRCPVCV